VIRSTGIGCVLLGLVVGACGATSGESDGVEVTEEPLAPSGGNYNMRFETGVVMCGVAKLDDGTACDASSTKCLCRPEFAALNTDRGSTGNPNGKVIVISQPKYGRRADGTYAFDAYAAIKSKNNFVAHYVNALNPALSCAACPLRDGEPSAGCGWKCIGGAARANQIIDDENATYGTYAPPKWIALNESWSLLYQDDATGAAYRVWVRDLVRQMSARNRWPLLYVQEKMMKSGPFPLLSEIASHAWIGVEAFVSGHDALDHRNCAAPFDATNYCYRQYRDVRDAVRNTATPPIPFDRLVMTEDFADNTRMKDGELQNWGRSYKDGTPSTGAWEEIIANRARAVKALPSLGGVSSYGWQNNEAGAASFYRVSWERAWSSVSEP